MNDEPAGPTRERLARFLSAHPGADERYSLSDIARELGVSREWVRKLLPGWRSAQRAKPTTARALQMFLAAHPEAVTSPARGGMTIKAIALAIGRNASVVGVAWRKLGLPDRRSMKLSPREISKRKYERNPAKQLARGQRWRATHPEQARDISRAARRRWLAKVIREEVCVICGVSFRWTNAREARLRQRGGRVVCSHSCGARGRRLPLGTSRVLPH